MRKFIYSLLVAGITLTGNAQENHKDPDSNTQSFESIFKNGPEGQTILVQENYSGEFTSDPLAFVEQRLGIENLLIPGQKEYQVRFSAKKGSFTAVFSKDGKLVETHQRFRNILVPVNVMASIYEQYPGWTMVKNTYFATGKADQVEHEKYRITLKKGNKTKRVNISPKVTSTALAAN